MATKLSSSESEKMFSLPAPITQFVGREEECDFLSSFFFVKNNKKVVICGLPGIGKSELAKQFAVKSLKDKFQKAYWINAETEDELIKVRPSLEHIFEESKGKQCLFILDNVTDIRILNQLIDFPEEYFYLITSNHKDLGNDIYTIELNSLTIDESVDFYKNYLGRNYNDYNQKLYKEIAGFIYFIPLGLQITAACILQAQNRDGPNFDLNRYLEYLKDQIFKFIKKIIPSKYQKPYENSFYGVIKTSLHEIETNTDNDPDFVSYVLNICSFLQPDGIDIDILLIILSNVDELETNKNMLEEAINLLHDYSLVNLDQNKIKISRFIQRVIRFHSTPDNSYIPNKYYKPCLESLLNYKVKYMENNNDLIFSSLQYADENDRTFETFYMENKYLLQWSNIKLFDVLLNSLIKYNCKNCITHILRNCSRELINKFNLLHRAANYNNIYMCEFLLKKGLKVNWEDKNQNTPSHVVSFNWNLNLIKMFIEHGANLYAINKHGNTPIFELFRGAFNWYNNRKRSDWDFSLLHYSIFENSVNKYGETLLHMACRSLNIKLVQILLEKNKIDVNKIDYRSRTPFYAAISVSNEPYATNEKINAMSKVLRRSGAYIGHENMTLFERALESVYRFNILHKLISSNLLEIFDLKLRFDIDINIVDENLNTLLHIASFHGNMNAIKLLIERNANITEKNNSGNTPFFEFVRGTYYHENISLHELNEIVDLLYCKDTVNYSSETILHAAAVSLNADLVDIFLTKYKMDVNVQNNSGETPLHVLFSKLKEDDITKNLLRIFETILQLKFNGASLEIKNANGMTPTDIAESLKNYHFNLFLSFEDRYIEKIKQILKHYKGNAQKIISKFNLIYYAIAYNQLEVLKLLLKKHNNDINSRNDKHITPLHLAALHWNIDAINILINHGADINIKNHEGRKPVHYFFLGAIQAKDLSKAPEVFRLLTNCKNISSEK